MSSLTIFSGGRPLEQRSGRTTAPSFVDAIHVPRILTSRRTAAAFSLGRQPEESVTRWNSRWAATENATKPCAVRNGVFDPQPKAQAFALMASNLQTPAPSAAGQTKPHFRPRDV